MTDKTPIAAATVKRLTVVSFIGFCQLMAFGSSLYLLTVLAAPIVNETHWHLSWVVGGYSVAVLTSAVMSPLFGRYVGAGQGHLVLAASSGLFTCGLLLMASAHSLIVYGLAWAVMGLAMCGGLYDTAFGTVGRLYGHELQGEGARNSIIQIALWGGFASMVFWPLSSFLTAHLGWRGTCMVYAAMHLFISLPIYLFIVPTPPDAAKPREIKAMPIVRPEKDEWHIYVALGFIVAAEMSIVALVSVHMHTILESRGLSPAVAVGLSAVVGPSQVFARLLEMVLGKRWAPYMSMMLGIAFVCAAVALIGFTTGLSLPALVLYGMGLGVVSITTGTVPLALFGPERYPPLMGRLRRIGLVLQALAPAIGAALLGYRGMTALLSYVLVLALICLGVAIYLAHASRILLASRPAPEEAVQKA